MALHHVNFEKEDLGLRRRQSVSRKKDYQLYQMLPLIVTSNKEGVFIWDLATCRFWLVTNGVISGK